MSKDDVLPFAATMVRIGRGTLREHDLTISAPATPVAPVFCEGMRVRSQVSGCFGTMLSAYGEVRWDDDRRVACMDLDDIAPAFDEPFDQRSVRTDWKLGWTVRRTAFDLAGRAAGTVGRIEDAWDDGDATVQIAWGTHTVKYRNGTASHIAQYLDVVPAGELACPCCGAGAQMCNLLLACDACQSQWHPETPIGDAQRCCLVHGIAATVAKRIGERSRAAVGDPANRWTAEEFGQAVGRFAQLSEAQRAAMVWEYESILDVLASEWRRRTACASSAASVLCPNALEPWHGNYCVVCSAHADGASTAPAPADPSCPRCQGPTQPTLDGPRCSPCGALTRYLRAPEAASEPAWKARMQARHQVRIGELVGIGRKECRIDDEKSIGHYYGPGNEPRLPADPPPPRYTGDCVKGCKATFGSDVVGCMHARRG